jgi:hypothetical protein
MGWHAGAVFLGRSCLEPGVSKQPQQFRFQNENHKKCGFYESLFQNPFIFSLRFGILAHLRQATGASGDFARPLTYIYATGFLGPLARKPCYYKHAFACGCRGMQNRDQPLAPHGLIGFWNNLTKQKYAQNEKASLLSPVEAILRA